MPIRTTTTLVGEICEVDPTINLAPFIAAASNLVDRIAQESSSPDDATLTLIETWLAAHFYCMRDPRTTQEAAGPVSASYQSKIDLHLRLTHYGQMAMTLDSSGILASINRGKRQGGVTWLGREDDRGQVDPNR